MIDLILKAIDRMIDLLEREKRFKRSTFHDHIEPLFSDLILIHVDYLSAFDELWRPYGGGVSVEGLLAGADQISIGELKLRIKARAKTMAPLRVKVIALSEVLDASDSLDKPSRHFVLMVRQYFNIVSDIPLPKFKGQSPTAFRTLFTVLDELSRISGDIIEPGDLKRMTDEIRADIERSWAVLTVAYAKLRMHLLAP